MKVRSTIACGFRREGETLLQEGLNDLDETRLTDGERLFISELAKEKIVEVLDDVPRAPESGTKLVEPAVEAATALDDNFETLTVPAAKQQSVRSGRRK